MITEQLLENFWNYKKKNNIEIYNEFSLQFELGIYLREKLGNSYVIQFERNVRDFSIPKTIKKEIDIVISRRNTDEKYAIEIKQPHNKQHPEAMYSCIKDICFLEQLRLGGFKRCFAFVFTTDSSFYDRKTKEDGIYSYFREQKIISGIINKPTGQHSLSVNVIGSYQIDWKSFGEEGKYYIVEIYDIESLES